MGLYALGAPWFALVLALSLVVVMVLSQRKTRRWSGRFVAARLVFIAALAPLVATTEGGVVGIVGVTAVGGAVVIERISRDPLLHLGYVRYANVSVNQAKSDAALIASRGTFTLNTIAIAVAVYGAFGTSTLVVLGAGVVGLACAVALMMTVRISSLREQRARREAREEIRRGAARYILHWDGPVSGTYQVEMWLPYLEELGVPYVIATRNRDTVTHLGALSSAPVMWCRNESDLDVIVTEQVRAVVYVNTALKNLHLIRNSRLMHIQLNHGDSDKNASVSKAFRMFDRNFVAGQAAVDRFAAAGVAVLPDQLRIVGRPQVASVERALPGATVRTILYAPTWGGYFADSNYTSLPQIEPVIDELLAKGLRVVFRPHPLTDRHPEHRRSRLRLEDRLAEHAAASGLDHVWGDRVNALSMMECMNISDAMIADVSSVVTDYLFAEKPLLMVSPEGAKSFVKTYPVARYAYLLELRGSGPEDVSVREALDVALNEDPMKGLRAAGRDYYLGDFPAATYCATFFDELRMAIEGLPTPES
ncbi:CDP-glycerol glycerophosphotransferase family protein [Microbacterium esteraromaticum]|uniref:CDP-glycerol glycerophosphotransferase family protein n=1 Tax=Microbacterium esteraromaticum TaxID=57043 RepID=A0A939DTF6_9MICO|nr:CDP-glycerol glycerophosphotransferase family protein [Microbacterium esteraromaticum]MBN8414724.1 CDP-glycerol glycerophosphotransferase family protein [Microbacterium esteraromaticum]